MSELKLRVKFKDDVSAVIKETQKCFDRVAGLLEDNPNNVKEPAEYQKKNLSLLVDVMKSKNVVFEPYAEPDDGNYGLGNE